MITKEKLSIYSYFKGDIDGWARIGTKDQKAMMINKDWALIESLIQDIRLINKGLASETYIKEINNRLRENCDSEETILRLMAMA